MKTFNKYPPILFHSKNVSQAFHIASITKFASIILHNNPQADILFAPFYTLYSQTKQKCFYSHLVRSNPIFQILNKKQSQAQKSINCRLVFKEADMYISPTAYAEKQRTHEVVPTWNYIGAQFSGTMQLLPNAQLKNVLNKQVQIFESEVGSKWRLDDAPQQYVQKLMKSIFPVKVVVNDWKVHKKLSQNKSPEQFNNVRKWCEKQGKREKDIVDWMDYYEKYTEDGK